ncbi:MAG: hypothetical protein UCH28_05455, partial [Adlercreutzia sp.]|nr:hypothetical protein [Adlercreutzia sp.]
AHAARPATRAMVPKAAAADFSFDFLMMSLLDRFALRTFFIPDATAIPYYSGMFSHFHQE